MKISPNSAVAFAFVACAMIVTSCAKDVETDMNIDPAGNAISFVPSVGGTTRATEITIKNLGDFAVVARGMLHDGALYDNFLIGGKTGGEIAHYSSLVEDETRGTWNLERDVQWPSSLERVLFIGYTTLKRGEKDNVSEDSENGVLGGDATFSVSETDRPAISNFQPLRNGLNDNVEGIWADGRSQKDLLVAFQQQERKSQTTVTLNFRHALTQVSIKAKQKDKEDTDHRIVKVKGAWIVNAAQSGTLSAKISVDEDKKVSSITTWTASDTKATYGSYYNDVRPLVKDSDTELLRHSLMLIPENLKEWDPKTWSTDNTETTDAYIMLLCRVELVHDGEGHAGANIEEIGVAGGKHYHQLFPVNAAKYNGAEYGFVCVPVSTDWANRENESDEDCIGMGKHYTYLLDICGRNSGAGIYPPIAADAAKQLIPQDATVTALVYKEITEGKWGYKEETVPLKLVTDIPGGKKVGDPVLDSPIKFDVGVSDWTPKPGDWTNGTANPSEDNN